MAIPDATVRPSANITMMLGAFSGAFGWAGQCGSEVEKIRPTDPSKPAYGTVGSVLFSVFVTAAFLAAPGYAGRIRSGGRTGRKTEG